MATLAEMETDTDYQLQAHCDSHRVSPPFIFSSFPFILVVVDDAAGCESDVPAGGRGG